LSRRLLVNRPHAAGLGTSGRHRRKFKRADTAAPARDCVPERNSARLIAMGIAMVSAVCGIAQAQEDRIEAECRDLLHRSVFNCGCTAEFPEDHLGSEQADILLRLWAYGENGGDQHDEMLDLYTRYGSEKISDAVMNFHRHRDDLRRYCAQGDAPTISD
jgi:hypothetical protein